MENGKAESTPCFRPNAHPLGEKDMRDVIKKRGYLYTNT